MALVDIGTIYNSLDTDPITVRFQGACLVAAAAIIAEDPTTPNHAARMAWANGMLSNDLTAVLARVHRHLRYAIATNATFQSVGTAIDDGSIQFIVNSQINTLA